MAWISHETEAMAAQYVIWGTQRTVRKRKEIPKYELDWALKIDVEDQGEVTVFPHP